MLDNLTEAVIGAAIEVHRILGPGLLESTYEQCLAHELSATGLSIERQKELPVKYKDMELDCGYRLDLVIDNRLIIELKACEQILPIHKAQLLTYMKLSGIKTGLFNFNVPLLKDGIHRLVL